MVRYLIVAVVACVYIACSILIVHRAGEHYRAELHRSRRLAVESKRHSNSPRVEETASPSVVDGNLGSPPPKPAATDTAPPPAAETPPKKAADHPAAVPPVVQVVKAPSTIVQPKKNADARPDGKAAPADPLANDPFWNQAELKDQWNVTHLTLDDERQFRDILHAVIIHFNPPVADASPWLTRLDEAARPFLDKLQRKEIKYQFFILDSDVVNAFSIPGGNIYVSRGLFNLIGEGEDYALEFVVGHEIAHVDLEHAIKRLRMKGMKELPRGTIFELYLLILPFGYVANDKINQEFDADDWVCNKMMQNLRTRREILAFLQKLEGYSKDNGFYTGRKPPQRGKNLSPAHNHYRAQVSARERLLHAKEYIAQFAAASK